MHIFRNYSAFIVVVSSAILVSFTNLAAGHDTSGFLFGYFGATDNYKNPLENKLFLKSSKKTTLALAPLVEAKTVADPTLSDKEDNDPSSPMVLGSSIVAENCPVLKDPEEDGGVAIYEVKDGDTVSSIAAANKINTNTILWANDMDNVDSIKPGDKLFIMPVSGLSYTVKKGDDIDSISKQYKADKDKIIAFNMLPANGDMKEGDSIIIPDGQKDIPKPTIQQQPPTSTGNLIAPRQYESFDLDGKRLAGNGSGSHSFPYGYCTWYVAQKRNIPWSGNAGTWLYKAKAAGYATSKTPRVGSVMVTSESWWGHVALVESVSGDTFTVSEMNYKGWAKKDVRTVNRGDRNIKGFIN